MDGFLPASEKTIPFGMRNLRMLALVTRVEGLRVYLNPRV